MKKILNLVLVLSLIVGLFSCGNSKRNSDNDTTKTEFKQIKSPFDEAISGTTPVVVDFYADWCKPCQIQGPIMVELAEELGDKIQVMKVDVDYERDLADRFKIQSIPTIMIFKENKIVFQAVGVQSKETLINVINQL